LVPTIVVLENAVGAERSVECPEGGDLVDIADDKLLPIPFSCRSATCGTCHVEVLAGGEYLEEPLDDEASMLDILGGPEGSRLACQAQVKSGAGLIKIRPF
jgi:2Fe-2S ferredoxin